MNKEQEREMRDEKIKKKEKLQRQLKNKTNTREM